MPPSDFSSRLIVWQQHSGRHGLPWQGADAYRVWLSEIMLQQTQVVTVIPYYRRFVDAFPDVVSLAAASEEQVLTCWSGLGYYARGRNLRCAAQVIAEKHDGVFPRRFEDILALPGVGRSTAAAVCALAYGERRAILDGNVRRVLARHRGIDGWPGDKKVEALLWQQAEVLLPSPTRAAGERAGKSRAANSDVATYTQALMDLGAMVCTRSRPKCAACPVREDCVALTTDRVAYLPSPRPRKAVPERHAVMLLLNQGSDILLEKRAPHGIWGGLWSLPQFDDEEAAQEWFLRNGMASSRRERLAPFTHTFTHFKLHITPLQIELAAQPLGTAQPGSVWMAAPEALSAAIPAPVRVLINKWVEGNNGHANGAAL